MMSVNLRGEMAAVAGLTKKSSLFSMTLIEKMAEVMRLSSSEVSNKRPRRRSRIDRAHAPRVEDREF